MKKIFVLIFVFFVFYSGDVILKEIPEKNWDAVITFSLIFVGCLCGASLLIREIVRRKEKIG